MLKFWKKPGRKESTVNSGSSSSSASSTPRNHSSPTYNGASFFSGNLSDQIKELETLIKADELEVKSSCLSKTLAEIIKDNEALTYLIQYLETVGCGAMIKFILDVESFNSALSSDCNLKTKLNQCNSIISSVVTDAKEKDVLVNQRKILDTRTIDISNTSLSNHDKGSDIDCDDSMSVDKIEKLQSKTVGDQDGDELEENKLLLRLINSKENVESNSDAVKIFLKYFSHKAPLKINIGSEIRKRLIDNLNSSVNKQSFLEVKEYVLKVIETEHFNDYTRSEFHCKYQIDILTNKKVCITDILYNETALFYFMEYLEQEGCTSFLEFWMSALNFQQQYEEQGSNYNSAQAQCDAMVLYDKYFSLQATNPLNLGDIIRIKVEESICREEGPAPNCFEYPRKIIVKLLEVNYFPTFIQSELYFKYLNELISAIQTSPLLGSRSRISGDSDCGSDVSISMMNTLLATEDAVSHKKLYKQFNSSSLSIDTQQLYDPDSLWQRGSKRPGLNFGRVNELGRFETDLEPEPDKKESKIAKAVKKLVNLSEDKSKEEMAWQVAAMIIRDVTNITMPPSTES